MSKNITSYDLLKTFAVIFMVVDHIGMYFFPDDLWWRAAGRACVPVWFFLVGYARGRDLSPKILIGAGMLIAANFLAGMSIFPLNVLVTIILIRLILNPLMTTTLSVTGREFWPMAMLLFLLAIPTMLITEYGTQALILSIFGYLVRHRQQVGNEKFIIGYMAFSLGSFVTMQALAFDFTNAHIGFVIGAVLAVHVVLLVFRPQEYSALTAKIPPPITWILQFCGHRTLEIYVAHLLIFKALAVYWGLSGYGFLDWRWIEL